METVSRKPDLYLGAIRQVLLAEALRGGVRFSQGRSKLIAVQGAVSLVSVVIFEC